MLNNPLSHWLALNQAALAHAVKNTLELSQQWKQLQADGNTQLLQAQLTALKQLPLQDMMALQQSLTHDLAAQSNAAFKAAASRLDSCIDALCETSSSDDVAMLVAGLAEDSNNQLRRQAGHVLTLLNSANTAVTVLTQRALNHAIAGAPPAQP